MILDYLERRSQDVAALSVQGNLRDRNAAQLVQKYESDWERNSHIAHLALQLFDQTQPLHQYGDFERDLLKFAALLHDVGQFISFRKHHKNSRYIINRTDPRGFTDEEVMLLGHLARYHCKAEPGKHHKKFRRLSKSHRRIVKVLSGILRIAVGLDKTKNQRVASLVCQLSEQTIDICITGTDSLALELWAARENVRVLAEALERDVEIQLP